MDDHQRGAGARLPEHLGTAGRTLAPGGGADRVAEALRDLVADGALVPGTQLPEDATSASLGVSRNTLREAFRLLVREGLLRHELHRGVFVRTLSALDVADVYRFRRVLEFAAVDGSHAPAALHRVRRSVEEGLRGARAGDWGVVGTANNHFHSAVVALAGSPRMDESMRHLLAELRLAYVVVPDARPFHEPYLEDNARIADHLEAGERGRAGRLLAAYLDRAEAQLTEAHERSAP